MPESVGDDGECVVAGGRPAGTRSFESAARASRGPVSAVGEPATAEAGRLTAPRIVTEVPGPRSRALVAREALNLAPGMQSIATLSGLAVARAEGSVIEDVDGNRYPRPGRRHLRQRPRPRAPALPPDPEGRRSTRSRSARSPRPPRPRRSSKVAVAHAAGPRQDPALLGRHRGGRGGDAPRQVVHEEVRVPLVLGRLPRQDRRRACP